MLLTVAVLPGDGIGPEVTAEAVRALEAVALAFGHKIELRLKEIGAASIRRWRSPLPEETLDACIQSDAVLLGSVGDPEFDDLPLEARPEAGLLKLRRELGAFANLRPVVAFPGLEASSPLKPARLSGTDIIIVRELLGGIYFGEPRGFETGEHAVEAINTMRYGEREVERVAAIAFELARTRRSKVTSVDKANVLECSRLWRRTVAKIAGDYPDVALDHQYVDSCAAALISRPSTFDVILTENMFGDILSDEAGALVGSLGLLASGSIGARVGLYEPVHGSAPDIAGREIANPIGAVLSAALMLRHSFDLEIEAACIERSVCDALAAGCRTRDLVDDGRYLTTSRMGEIIADQILNSAREHGVRAT